MSQAALRLEQKCDKLYYAQAAYFRVIREGHAGWAAAAGFQIGRMYEILYLDLIALPVPQDLDAETRQLYLDSFQKRVKILLEKAMRAWQANLDMAVRTGTNNEWIAQTEESMKRVKELVARTNETRLQINTEGNR